MASAVAVHAAPQVAPAYIPLTIRTAPYFTFVGKRLWPIEGNGGCTGQHLLRIYVLDAHGNPLNGVTLQGIFIGDALITGAQGKGDGIIEYDLYGSGEGFRVAQDMDGRAAASDLAIGFTTRSVDISDEHLIPAGYCADHEDCERFRAAYGCHGHHSWDAIFQHIY